jgi:hypothetical protein
MCREIDQHTHYPAKEAAIDLSFIDGYMYVSQCDCKEFIYSKDAKTWVNPND